MKHFEKALELLSFYLLPAGLFVSALLWPKNSHFYLQLGEVAWILVLLVLFIKPIAVLTRNKTAFRLCMLRRELGVASFWLFIFHAAGLIYNFNLTVLPDYFILNSARFWGTTSGIGMLLLGLTSNNFSMKLLKEHWKDLQYLAYPTLFLAGAHKYMAEDKTLWPAILIFCVFIALKCIEWQEKD